MISEKVWFGQEGYHCRLQWGRRGAQIAAAQGDILVVVDVLSFSTVVATAAERSAIIYPCGTTDDAAVLAARWNAVATVRREEVPGKGRYSLSPETLLAASTGERIVVPSPNGAACTQYGSAAPLLLVGALVNAASAAAAAAQAAFEKKVSVTILACGEHWHTPHDDGELRFALEDYLGAGAIIAHLPASLARSPEASLCEAAFAASVNRLPEILRACGSGIELIARGYPRDIEHAARLSVYTAVPRLNEGLFFSA